MENTITIQETEQIGRGLKQQGKKIVLVGGCFDLLHFGHITLLDEAKKQGDILIVLLESDQRIQELKGSNRPLHTQKQRAQMLCALKSVDYVILLPDRLQDADYDSLVKQLQPDIIATTKGSKTLQFIERQAKEIGARVHSIDPVPNLSTSRIIDAVMKEL